MAPKTKSSKVDPIEEKLSSETNDPKLKTIMRYAPAKAITYLKMLKAEFIKSNPDPEAPFRQMIVQVMTDIIVNSLPAAAIGFDDDEVIALCNLTQRHEQTGYPSLWRETSRLIRAEYRLDQENSERVSKLLNRQIAIIGHDQHEVLELFMTRTSFIEAQKQEGRLRDGDFPRRIRPPGRADIPVLLVQETTVHRDLNHQELQTTPGPDFDRQVQQTRLNLAFDRSHIHDAANSYYKSLPVLRGGDRDEELELPRLVKVNDRAQEILLKSFHSEINQLPRVRKIDQAILRRANRERIDLDDQLFETLSRKATRLCKPFDCWTLKAFLELVSKVDTSRAVKVEFFFTFVWTEGKPLRFFNFKDKYGVWEVEKVCREEPPKEAVIGSEQEMTSPETDDEEPSAKTKSGRKIKLPVKYQDEAPKKILKPTAAPALKPVVEGPTSSNKKRKASTALAVVRPTPLAPVFSAPAPVMFSPTPVFSAPAPVMFSPAPVFSAPVEWYYGPAPVSSPRAPTFSPITPPPPSTPQPPIRPQSVGGPTCAGALKALFEGEFRGGWYSCDQTCAALSASFKAQTVRKGLMTERRKAGTWLGYIAQENVTPAMGKGFGGRYYLHGSVDVAPL